MSDSANTPPRKFSDADQRALDALLTEALDPRSGQRDFSTDILARVQRKSVQLPRPQMPSRTGRRSGSGWIVAAATAVIAASVLVMLLVRGPWNPAVQLAQPEGNGEASQAARPNDLAGSDAAGALRGRAEESAAESQAAVAAARTPRKPPVVLSDGVTDVDPANSEAEPQASADVDLLANQSVPKPRAGDAQLADFNHQFVAYWEAIGVTPAPRMDQSAWLERIADRFGWQPDETSRQPLVDQAFTGREASRALAQRLMDQLLVGLKPNEERRERLVQEATQVIATGGRFDRWLSGWVTDETWWNESSDDRTQDPALAGEWLASRVIGADVSCAKCHDSPIDSRYVQHDFWSTAALFSPSSGPPLFYELEDRRQKVAAPGIPTRWFGPVADGEPSSELASREELSGLMLGSPQVARTLANHLWTIGFGTPLVAASSSPMAPPRDEALDRALVMLGDHLLSENFDIRAAARWVIASDPMKRGVPEELSDGRWQRAGEEELAAASLAQRAFAAAKGGVPQASRTQLLAVMQSRSGLIPATLAAPDSLLAQPRPLSPQQSGKTDRARRNDAITTSPANLPERKAGDLEDYWWTQWLADREALQGGWLDSIGDADQQLRHAFYAAGYRDIDREQLKKVEALLAATQKSDQDRSETIAQIHWILQNSR